MIQFRFLILAAAFGVASSSAWSADKTLWDAWYTVTVNGTTHYEYYNEKVEIKKEKLYFQNSLWKQEEGFINEEQLGAFAENNPEVTPLFYNFHGAYRTSETIIDASMNGKELNVRIKKEGKDLPIVKRNLPTKTFFSQFFPIWLSRHLGELQKGKSLSFSTILEDNIDNQFSPDEGTAKLETPDDFSKKTSSKKVSVQYRGLSSVWWINDRGETLKLILPDQKTIVERVSQKEAKKFFDTKPGKSPSDSSEEG